MNEENEWQGGNCWKSHKGVSGKQTYLKEYTGGTHTQWEHCGDGEEGND